MNGEKDALWIWIGANESSKFQLSALNDTRSRGAVYPNSKIQRCIIHQLGVSMKYILHKDKRAFTADLRTIYNAINEEQTLENLTARKEKWCDRYPNVVRS